MSTTHQLAPLQKADCEIRTDDLTRQLFASDASIYQIVPAAVAFPRSPQEAAAAIAAADEAGLVVTPRGAGTGLAGGALGDGLIIDFARYNREITDFDPDTKTVRVGPGVVLDQLNEFAKQHGLVFGPDVATSSRATFGGMIANNSSGARAPIYGTTAEHVVSLDVVLADGRIETIGAGQDGLADLRDGVSKIVSRHAKEINERFPDVLCKRWPGYGLDRYLRADGDLCTIVSASEGTLAGILSAEVKLVPLQRTSAKGLAIFFFASVAEAMQATVEFLDLAPAAIEHVDRVAFDQTRGNLAFQPTRDLLGLDDDACEAFLIVEFYDDVEEKVAEARRRKVGLRNLILTDASEMDMVWAMRKAGLSLLTGRKGPAKPIAGIEDVAVLPQRLPEYVEGLAKVMDDLELKASFYGHAASGLLHVRPIVDLHVAEDIEKYRTLCKETAALTLQFKGSFAAEHGVGMARTEFMPELVGEELLGAMEEIKDLFDPGRVLNRGKIFPDGYDYRIETNLRQGAGHQIELPFPATLAFAAKDESFIGNLEQCNGCGGCRKDAPTMCPTYIATGEEIMSTRGRANTIRAVLEGRLGINEDPLRAKELEEALSNCLSCKTCAKECPSNVNLALLKAELSHARQRRDGLTMREIVVSSIETMNQMGCMMPGLANKSLKWKWLRKLMDWAVGFAWQRPLPEFTDEPFHKWFAEHKRNGAPAGTRGTVVLWDDTFVRYNEPHIGKAAVKVLEALGYEVRRSEGHKDCGRPAFSVGRLDMARRLGHHNVKLLRAEQSEDPVIFLEPSSYAMFVSDYKELGIEGAGEVAKRCTLFEQFVLDVLEETPDALDWKDEPGAVAIHAHCHAKALTDVNIQEVLAKKIPGLDVDLLKTGCCGMAGQFGALREKYELSLQIAEPLVRLINERPAGAYVVASGTSCRHQISHLTDAHPIHMAELLAGALRDEE